MKKIVLTIFVCVIVAIIIAFTGKAEAGRGCCSWHNGVCGCSNGRVLCCDGTLSPSCRC